MKQPAISSTGLILDFDSAGILDWSDVHLARFLAGRFNETNEQVILAAALTVAALRNGSVCLELANPLESALGAEEFDEIDISKISLPDSTFWAAALIQSPMIAVGESGPINERPLRLVDGLLYLERYWVDQEDIRRILLSRVQALELQVDKEKLADFLINEFAGESDQDDPAQQAVNTALISRTTVIAGGPGTGKTTTIGRILRAFDQVSTKPISVALAAPTGKAAARMGEALTDQLALFNTKVSVQGPKTIHKLLGAKGPHREYEYGAHSQLGADVVIIDEMSMVPLPMMATLLRALRDDTQLILVGDPDQLTSIDVGSVLGDIVAASLPISSTNPESSVVTLTKNHRSGGNVHTLAMTIKQGSVDDVFSLLDGGHPDLDFIECDPAVARLSELYSLTEALLGQARSIHLAALGSAATTAVQTLDQHRLLCAHRTGPAGVKEWSAKIDALFRAAIPGFGAEGNWYLGRSVLITSNLQSMGLNNGDTGVVISTDQGARVVFDLPTGTELFAPHLLDSAETVTAMTIHKSQGSQFDWVTVVLPNEESPLLTKELLYTAVTRAKSGVRIIGTRAAITKAIQTPVRRTSGLADRLRTN